ncbi:MAG: hypothetical protein IPM59_09770 [Chloracidobacterium sp.]|nr:hypothetical protein [Chloracidobacterium sp.]
MTHTNDRNFRWFFGIDTAVVLFFLALEYGRAVRVLTLDGILMAITMAMIVVLPYFLPSNYQRPAFFNWLMGRTGIMALGLVLGASLTVGIDVGLPASLRFMPMTFLILTTMISCYVQFYGLLRLRPAK